jgi:hypothetical protein
MAQETEGLEATEAMEAAMEAMEEAMEATEETMEATEETMEATEGTTGPIRGIHSPKLSRLVLPGLNHQNMAPPMGILTEVARHRIRLHI